MMTKLEQDFKLLSSFEESDISKIFDNEFFGYTKSYHRTTPQREW